MQRVPEGYVCAVSTPAEMSFHHSSQQPGARWPGGAQHKAGFSGSNAHQRRVEKHKVGTGEAARGERRGTLVALRGCGLYTRTGAEPHLTHGTLRAAPGSR